MSNSVCVCVCPRVLTISLDKQTQIPIHRAQAKELSSSFKRIDWQWQQVIQSDILRSRNSFYWIVVSTSALKDFIQSLKRSSFGFGSNSSNNKKSLFSHLLFSLSPSLNSIYFSVRCLATGCWLRHPIHWNDRIIMCLKTSTKYNKKLFTIKLKLRANVWKERRPQQQRTAKPIHPLLYFSNTYKYWAC